MLESSPADSVEYRLSRDQYECGLVGAIFFGLTGVFCVFAILTNIDGAMRHPVLGAVLSGSFCGIPALACGWLVLYYLRHRLIVSSHSVQLRTSWTERTLQPSTVLSARWSTLWRGGSLMLEDDNGQMKIRFANYTYADRAALIDYFRKEIPTHLQEGWPQFEQRCKPPQLDFAAVSARTRRNLRFTAVAWSLALPPMYAILVYTKLVGNPPRLNWTMVVLIPPAIVLAMVGMGWFASRSDLAKIDRPESTLDR